MHGLNAGHELVELVVLPIGGGGAGRVVDGTLHVVEHGKEASHELLGCALLLVQTLLGGATAVVVPVGLQAQEAVLGVRGLLLGRLDGVVGLGQLALKLLEPLVGVRRDGLLGRGFAGTLGRLDHGVLVGLDLVGIDRHLHVALLGVLGLVGHAGHP